MTEIFPSCKVALSMQLWDKRATSTGAEDKLYRPNLSPLASTGAKDVQMGARFGSSKRSKLLSKQNSHLTSMDYLCILPSACLLSCPRKWQHLFLTSLSESQTHTAKEEETVKSIHNLHAPRCSLLPPCGMGARWKWSGSKNKCVQTIYIYII